MTEAEQDGITVTSSNNVSYGSGLLGATADHPDLLASTRLEMIERRILRLEMLLRRNGIEPESLGLPR